MCVDVLTSLLTNDPHQFLSTYGFNHDKMFDRIHFVVDKRHWSKYGSVVEEYISHL
jgi:hypothetical protein